MQELELYDVTDFNNMADHIGKLSAEIKELTTTLNGMKALVKANASDLVGAEYSLKIVHSDRVITDWKKIAIALGATSQRIVSNSKHNNVISIRTARI